MKRGDLWVCLKNTVLTMWLGGNKRNRVNKGKILEFFSYGQPISILVQKIFQDVLNVQL